MLCWKNKCIIIIIIIITLVAQMDYWCCVSVCLSVCLFLCVSVFSRERHNVQMLRASLSETSGNAEDLIM